MRKDSFNKSSIRLEEAGNDLTSASRAVGLPHIAIWQNPTVTCLWKYCAWWNSVQYSQCFSGICCRVGVMAVLWVMPDRRLWVLWRWHDFVTPGSLQQCSWICLVGTDQSGLLSLLPCMSNCLTCNIRDMTRTPVFALRLILSVSASFTSIFHQPLHTSLLNLSLCLVFFFSKGPGCEKLSGCRA